MRRGDSMKHRFAIIIAALMLCLAAASCVMTQKPKSAPTSSSPAVIAAGDTTGESTPPAAATESGQPDTSDIKSEAAVTESPLPSQDSLTSSALSAQPSNEPSDDTFVRVIDYIPSICIDLKYASADNFTGQVIYDFEDAYLRYGTIKKLAAAQEKLSEQGFSLKIWDAFRPVAAQFKLWEVYPDPNFIADPNKGYSAHSKGNTVDVTLVFLSDGTDVSMPTGYDEFSDLTDRDYSDVAFEVAANAMTLETVMSECGFTGYSKEWWHYTDSDSYPVEEVFTP